VYVKFCPSEGTASFSDRHRNAEPRSWSATCKKLSEPSSRNVILLLVVLYTDIRGVTNYAKQSMLSRINSAVFDGGVKLSCKDFKMD
jgi:hypothetical protein